MRIGDEGLLIRYGDKREKPTWIDQGSRLAAGL
jgi:hypothetical protein